MVKLFTITPVYDLLLRGTADLPVGLYHLHLATAVQLTRLHYKPGMIKTVKARLKLLSDNGFIQAHAKPTQRGNGPYYYVMDTAGLRYLSDTGTAVDPVLRASKEAARHHLFIDHTLELNDIRIAALRVRQVRPEYELYTSVHERTFKRRPYKAGNFSLVPDTFLEFRQHRPGLPSRAWPVLLEHDRGTEGQEHFKRRIRAYRAFLYEQAYKRLLGVETVTVCFTTMADMPRLVKIREWTRQELHDTPNLAALFLFADLPKPPEPQDLLFDRRWYTLLDDQPIALLEG